MDSNLDRPLHVQYKWYVPYDYQIHNIYRSRKFTRQLNYDYQSVRCRDVINDMDACSHCINWVLLDDLYVYQFTLVCLPDRSIFHYISWEVGANIHALMKVIRTKSLTWDPLFVFCFSQIVYQIKDHNYCNNTTLKYRQYITKVYNTVLLSGT